MKQLLNLSGNNLITALHDRTYALISGGNASGIYELCPPQTKINQQNQNGQESGNVVQAVTLASSAGECNVICAVSRFDKRVAIYIIPIPADGAVNDAPAKKVQPSAIYATTRRACSLDFTTIPAAAGKELPLQVLVAADLAGDATAFPVPETSVNSSNQNDLDISKVSRLLLGHTASMLTGVKVVTDANGVMRILTSDRDEKIRVSSFPCTYAVEGYLLGHEAFVSCLDAATDPGCTKCVTASGDGTIRLWDYIQCKELASVSAIPNKEEENKEGENKTSVVIPMGVAMNADASLLAVIRHEAVQLEIYRVSERSDGVDIILIQTIDCECQPLAVDFHADGSLFVLTKEPTFCLQFGRTKNNNDGAPFESITEQSAVCASLKELGKSHQICMPTTVLGQDDSGMLVMGKTKQKPAWHEQGHEPWNDVNRVERDKNRQKRRRKRLKQQDHEAAGTENYDDSTKSDEE
eukprot:scaffold4059_cov52-Attheya_sp.AAC.4